LSLLIETKCFQLVIFGAVAIFLTEHSSFGIM
jgi:hypothetical protein